MGEKQEKVWVVLRSGPYEEKYAAGDLTNISDKPVKVFDDRKDAIAYIKDRSKRTRRYIYSACGVKKG